MQPNYFNQDDVIYLIRRIKAYHDDYSIKHVNIFKRYLQHRCFEKMHDALFKVDHLLHIPFYDVWDVETRMVFLEVIYPA